MEGEHEISMNTQTGVPAPDQQSGTARLWSNTQAYGLAFVCLVLGLAVGFLFHGPAGSATVSSRPPAPQQQVESAAVTPERLKHMANKTVEPLLEKLKQDPNDSKLLYDIGNAYYATHQFGTAAEYYSKSADVEPDPKVLTQLSNAYHYAGADDKAFAALDRTLQINPSYANALFNLGMLRFEVRGDSTGAIEAWQKLLKTNPNHPHRRQVEMMIDRARQGKAALKAAE